MIHDAFQDLSYWNGYMNPADGFQGVAMDHHSYGVFSTPELQQTWDQHISVRVAQMLAR